MLTAEEWSGFSAADAQPQTFDPDAPVKWEDYQPEPIPIDPASVRIPPQSAWPVGSGGLLPGNRMGPFGPENAEEVITGPNLARLGVEEAELAREGFGKAQALAEKIGHPVAGLLHGLTIPFRLATGNTMLQAAAEAPKEGEPFIPEIMPGADEHGIVPSLRRFAGGLTTGGSLVTLPFVPESKIAEGAFLGQSLLGIPEGIRQMGDAKTTDELLGAATDTTINAAMAFLIGRHMRNGAEVPVAGEPAAARGAEPVTVPQGEEVPRGTLTPEELAYIDAEREGLDRQVEVQDLLPADQPFARNIATIDRTSGKILINPKEFSDWLKQVPEERRQDAVKSLLNEERIHLAVTDQLADAYWSGLTAAEKAITRRRYTGTFAGDRLQSGEAVHVSDTDFGHEAVRFRMQQLARMTPREIAEAVGRERWTLQGLTALETVIRTVRETLGTRASGIQRAILERVQRNLDAAKDVSYAYSATSPQDFAKKSGWTMKTGQKAASVNIPDDLTNLPEKDQALYREMQAKLPRVLEFTDRRKGSPTEGITFYVPENASGADIVKAYQGKLAQAEAAKGPGALNKGLSGAERDLVEKQLKRAQDRIAELEGNIKELIENGRKAGKLYPDDQRILAQNQKDLELVRADEAEFSKRLEGGEQSFPAALRKSTSEEPSLPGQLGIPMYEQFRKAMVDSGWPSQTFPTRPNLQHLNQAIDFFATTPEKEWKLPAGLKDQLHAWFDQQTGGAHDRYRLIAQRLEDMELLNERAKQEKIGRDDEFTFEAQEVPEGDEWKEPTTEELEQQNDEVRAEAERGPYDEDLAKLRKLAADYARSVNRPRDQYAPAALRKRAKGEPGQDELMLPPMQPGEQRETPAAAKATPPNELPLSPGGTPEGRPGATEFTPIANAKRIEAAADEHLQGNSRPSFAKFAEEINRFGTLMKGQLRELWTDAVWRNLSRMGGDQLSRIRDSLGLGTKLGTRVIEDAAPELPPVQGRLAGLEGEKALGRRPAGVRAIEAQMKSPGQKYRNTVIGRIGERLIGEADTGQKAWKRSKIGPEDLGHWRETSSGAFFDVTGEDLKEPGTVGRMLTEGAAVERSTTRRKVRGGQVIETQTKAPPESVTKRVTAMVDRVTGKVHLVSTYRKPRSGAMLLDPALINKQRMHRPLADLLERYRPIASALLDEPVQNFHQTFDSVRKFETEFAKPARAEANRQASYEAKYGEPAEGEDKGQLETQFTQPLNEDEATGLFDQLHEEVGKIDRVEDIQDALTALKNRVSWDKLRPMDFNALGAYVKAYDAIRATDPNLSPEQAMDRMAQEIYDKVKNAESVEGFNQDFMDSYSGSPRQAVRGIAEGDSGTTAPSQKKGVSRDLTLYRDIPPTVDPNVEVPKGPGPEARLPEPTPPEKLSPEELDHVQELAHQRFPYTPTAEPTLWDADDQLPEGTGENSPGALRKRGMNSQSLWDRTLDAVLASAARRSTRKDLPRILDGLNRGGELYATEAGSNIRLASNEDLSSTPKGFKARLFDPVQTIVDGYNYVRGKSPTTEPEMRRAAVHVFIAAGRRNKYGGWYPDKNMITRGTKFQSSFRSLLRIAEQRANNKLRFGDKLEKRLAKASLEYIDELKQTLDYAEAHWRDPEMWKVIKAFRQEMKAEIDFENRNGSTVPERDNYFPGRYEADFWHDNGINFGSRRKLLGTIYRKQKTFQNLFEAIAAGPYIAASLDAADLAQHRISQGRRNIAGRMWTDSLKYRTDPDSNQPIAKEPVQLFKPTEVTDPTTGMKFSVNVPAGWKSPDPTTYELMQPGGINSKPVAVRTSYKHLVEILLEPSKIDRFPLAPELHMATSVMKHGVILILDTFHPGRVLQYGASMLGYKVGSKGGYSALNYRLADLDRAVKQGEISKEAADWAKEKVNVRMGPSSIAQMTRKELSEELIKQGLNATKIGDALYKDVVQHVPIIGETSHRLLHWYNSWLFQKFMPGLMLETAVRSFEKYNKSNPGIPLEKLAKDVVRDVNTRYGNLGKQGVFRSKTFQDAMQILLLAPMWQEGIVRSELMTLGRLTGLSYLTGRRGLPWLGTLGSGVMKGLGAYVALTQTLNLITRGQPTWKNEEPEHKWDAWLPIGEHGVWISPMSVFAEVSHDIYRLSQSKATMGDALAQMAANRMGPFGKALYTLVRNESPTGEKYTSTMRRIGGAAAAAAPTPIAFGTLGRLGASAAFPNTFSPPQPGAVPRQPMASLTGIKVEAGKSALQEQERKARDWMQKNGLQPQPYLLSPTDQANYAKLRNAIRNKDEAEARRLLKELRGFHSDTDILKAMKRWKTSPLTGSKTHEQLYLNDLSDKELESYQQATEEKLTEYNLFVDWLLAHPQ